MRPDGLRLADTLFDEVPPEEPILSCQNGYATTTLPCITSLFLVFPLKYTGFGECLAKPAEADSRSFDVIHHRVCQQRLFTTGALRDLSRPGPLQLPVSQRCSDDGGQTDREVSALALSWLQSHEWAFSLSTCRIRHDRS